MEMHYLPVYFNCMTLWATVTVDIQSQDALNVTPVHTLYFCISCRSTYVQLFCTFNRGTSRHVATAPSGPRPPHYRGFTITLRHTTFVRTPLDEWSARRRDLYLTAHNIVERQRSMPQTRFEPAIPASERPQTDALVHAYVNFILRGLQRQSAIACPKSFRLWVRIPPEHRFLSLVGVVCCQVEVSASGRSFFQKSPIVCAVSEWDREASTMGRLWPRKTKVSTGLFTFVPAARNIQHTKQKTSNSYI